MYVNIEQLNCDCIKEGKGYLAYINLGKDVDGKRLRPKARGKSEDEAIAKLEKKLRDMGLVQPDEDAPKLDIVMGGFTSILDAAQEFRVNCILRRVTEKEITSRTAENYVYALAPFETVFQAQTLGDIDAKKLNQFFKLKAAQKKPNGEYVYSQTTLKRIELVVHMMFSRAVKHGWISNDPFTSYLYKKPKALKNMAPIEGLETEEIMELMKTLKEAPIVYVPLCLMLNTGMRTQEVIGLKWGDIDFKRNRLKVCRAVTVDVKLDEKTGKVKRRNSVVSSTKTEGSQREVELTEEARQLLMDWYSEAPEISATRLGDDDFIFGYETKPNFTYNAFRSRVNDFLSRKAEALGSTGNMEGKEKHATLDTLRLHRLRHTVGTLLAAEGREVIQIMRQLGITQVKTLLRYVDKKANAKILEENAAAISKALTGCRIKE